MRAVAGTGRAAEVWTTKLAHVSNAQFEDAELTVGSTIAPDEDSADGSRFNFAFEKCTLRWRSFEVPLPPVGRVRQAYVFVSSPIESHSSEFLNFLIC